MSPTARTRRASSGGQDIEAAGVDLGGPNWVMRRWRSMRPAGGAEHRSAARPAEPRHACWPLLRTPDRPVGVVRVDVSQVRVPHHCCTLTQPSHRATACESSRPGTGRPGQGAVDVVSRPAGSSSQSAGPWNRHAGPGAVRGL